MPTGPRLGLGRIVSVATLVVATAAIAVLILGSGSQYRIHALFSDAGQLVKGDRVQVGGIPIGSVSKIELDDNNRARVTLDITDARFDPLHSGTIATIGTPSLSTEASRFIDLQPAPNSNGRLADGATIGTHDTRPIVDLDELLNSLDYQVRTNLQQIVHGSAVQYGSGQAPNANRGLEYLSPALAQTARLTGELNRDQGAFERFIVESAAVVSAIAPRDPQLQHGLTSAAVLTQRLARQDTTIGDLLTRAPAVLRKARGTLARVNTALVAARPTLRAAAPVAPRFARVLRLVVPVLRTARPAVRQLAALLPDVASALRGLPKLDRIGSRAFSDTTSALRGLSPIVAALRPYVPDVVGGLMNGFGGNVAGYYDANGRYARIGFSLPPNFLVQGASGLGGPIAQLFNQGQGGGEVTQIPDYCPGGSTFAPPDASAPYLDPSVKGHCNPDQKPPGKP